MQAQVSRRAVIARINRKLGRDGQVLKVTRPGTRLHDEFGPYYIVNYHSNAIADWGLTVTLEQRARDLGALAAWEVLADD
jgi:hypothetical protein